MKIEGEWKSTVVYAIKHFDKIIYVGKTSTGLKQRIFKHFGNAISDSKRVNMSCPKLYEYIRKNPNKEEYSIVCLGQFSSKEADEKEIFFISHYKTREDGIGLNVAPGGNSSSGKDHYLYGKPVERHIVEASVKARIGKPLTEEHKRKQSEGQTRALKTRKDLTPIRCKETGQEWISLHECARFFDVDPMAIKSRINKVFTRNRKNEKLQRFTFEHIKDG